MSGYTDTSAVTGSVELRLEPAWPRHVIVNETQIHKVQVVNKLRNSVRPFVRPNSPNPGFPVVFRIIQTMTDQDVDQDAYHVEGPDFYSPHTMGQFKITFLKPLHRRGSPLRLIIQPRRQFLPDVLEYRSEDFRLVSYSLRVDEQPEPIFYKDDGGKRNNYLTTVIEIQKLAHGAPDVNLMDMELEYSLKYEHDKERNKDNDQLPEPRTFDEIQQLEKPKRGEKGHTLDLLEEQKLDKRRVKVNFRINDVSSNHQNKLFNLVVNARNYHTVKGCGTGNVQVKSKSRTKYLGYNHKNKRKKAEMYESDEEEDDNRSRKKRRKTSNSKKPSARAKREIISSVKRIPSHVLQNIPPLPTKSEKSKLRNSFNPMSPSLGSQNFQPNAPEQVIATLVNELSKVLTSIQFTPTGVLADQDTGDPLNGRSIVRCPICGAKSMEFERRHREGCNNHDTMVYVDKLYKKYKDQLSQFGVTESFQTDKIALANFMEAHGLGDESDSDSALQRRKRKSKRRKRSHSPESKGEEKTHDLADTTTPSVTSLIPMSPDLPISPFSWGGNFAPGAPTVMMIPNGGMFPNMFPNPGMNMMQSFPLSSIVPLSPTQMLPLPNGAAPHVPNPPLGPQIQPLQPVSPLQSISQSMSQPQMMINQVSPILPQPPKIEQPGYVEKKETEDETKQDGTVKVKCEKKENKDDTSMNLTPVSTFEAAAGTCPPPMEPDDEDASMLPVSTRKSFHTANNSGRPTPDGWLPTVMEPRVPKGLVALNALAHVAGQAADKS